MPWHRAVPALPVASVVTAAQAYVDRLGFTVVHLDPTRFAIVVRDAVEIHLWEASDHGWRHRPPADLAAGPVRTGAEDFLAGTGSCRIACGDAAEVDAVHSQLAASGLLHPSDDGSPVDTGWGTREVAGIDVDGNLLTFFARVHPR